MRALLLSAGYGLRLRPITDTIPKCLVPINGKPLLQYWLEMLISAGIKDVLVNTHYLADKVKNFIDGSEYKQYVTVVYEETLLGTGGTLLKNREFFQGDTIMLIHADNLSKFDMNAFIERHSERPSGTEITMMTFKTDTPQSCGIVSLDERGVVQAFYEKVNHPPGNLANGAVFILESSILNFLKNLNKKEIDFSAEVIPQFIGEIFTYQNTIFHRDIGNLESLMKANAEYR